MLIYLSLFSVFSFTFGDGISFSTVEFISENCLQFATEFNSPYLITEEILRICLETKSFKSKSTNKLLRECIFQSY